MSDVTDRPGFSYTDLRIWQLGMDLADQVFQATKAYPRSELFGMTSQMRSASTSVPSNIAEGWGRGTQPQLAQFVRIARGSLFELDTLVKLSGRYGYLAEQLRAQLEVQIDTLGRKTHSFLTKIEGSYVRENLTTYDAAFFNEE